MQTTNARKSGRYKNPLCRVTLSPELEEEAGLWTIQQTEQALRDLEKITRQLRVKLAIMKVDRRRVYAARPTPALKLLKPHVLAQN